MIRIISTIPFIFGLITYYIVALSPSNYSLLEQGFLSSIKKQHWGTCWAFSTISSLESNILKRKLQFSHDLSEYHLDKFNGFNRNGRESDPKKEWFSTQGKGYIGSNRDDQRSGLMVHLGGDYRVAAAYLSNTLGAVEESKTPGIKTDSDFASFGNSPGEGILLRNNYQYIYPKSIEWLVWGNSNLETQNRIKKAIKENGAVASAQFMESSPLAIIKGKEWHQNLKEEGPNHAISIVGWDDRISYKGKTGAWLIKDSDHINEEDNTKIGLFYISYQDLITGKHRDMGAVSFKNVSLRDSRARVYSHALHGWRYSQIFPGPIKNLYTIKGDETLNAIGLYLPTPQETATYKVSINGNFLLKETINRENPGFYYLKIPNYDVRIGDKVEIIQENKSTLYSIDSSSWITVLLGDTEDTLKPQWVESKANPKESYYYEKDKWYDLTSKESSSEINYRKANFPIILYTLNREELK
ncbi:hypothetical protein [Halobacteriovorax sp. JY17]|uniref:hypothetical protein n=1 Tax=Halobacteriovorax sp. JY17 TaxID=2014617 RepID=UPI000C4FF196|nr:hypothetical protein [Halobacteriovorax sp. JY17]PIK14036.1 MAG: hypothetical protein CES88_13715 [Halobacteriovorax sp. JY17]